MKRAEKVTAPGACYINSDSSCQLPSSCFSQHKCAEVNSCDCAVHFPSSAQKGLQVWLPSTCACCSAFDAAFSPWFMSDAFTLFARTDVCLLRVFLYHPLAV